MLSALKRCAVLVLALFCAGLFPAAPAPAERGTGGVDAAVSLEEAILVAKKAFPAASEYEQFSSGYQAGEDGAFWNLYWSREGRTGGSMQVTVSADDGRIISMYLHRPVPPGTIYTGLPRYSREAARAIAEDIARKLQPELFRQTRPAPELVEVIPLAGLGKREYPVYYSYHFQRVKDGIPVAENGINVRVNADTGEVQSFSVLWKEDLELPDASGRLGPARARNIFDLNGLELVYVYTGRSDRDTGERPYLVYRLRDGGFLLDALTGELLDAEDGYWLPGSGEGAAQRAMPDLSPEETAAVEETGRLLSAAEARRAAEAAYTPPRGVKLTGTQLTQHWSVPGGRVWNIAYADEEGKLRVDLAVDARTGEFLRFSLYRTEERPPARPPAVAVGEDEARRKAEALIRRLQPDKFKEVTLRDTRPQIGPWLEDGEPQPRAYAFEYARLVHGVPYPENGFSVTVDAVTGEVTAYRMSWWDTDFPPSTGIISRSDANAAFLTENSLVLEYTRLYPRLMRTREVPPYSLVYRLDGRMYAMVDARSGELLDRRGKPLVKRTEGFTDIAGHPAEREIMLLVESGVVTGAPGDRFRPDDPVTNAELAAMLVTAYGGRHYPPEPLRQDGSWYEPYWETAAAMGILDGSEALDPAAPATRLQAARFLVNAQGFGPLARLSALFRLDAADADAVPAAERGFAAAAAGLELLPLQEGRFNPGGSITRGEAAQVLVRALAN